jgi:hypothetical protein
MKLTNYRRGYNPLFECSIHGTIYMTRTEYDELVPHLYYKYSDSTHATDKELLSKDLSNRQKLFKNNKYVGFRINLGVTLTVLIVKRYELKGYKLGNYQLQVKE